VQARPALLNPRSRVGEPVGIVALIAFGRSGLGRALAHIAARVAGSPRQPHHVRRYLPCPWSVQPSRAGLARARSEGKELGRPPIAPELEKRIHEALNKPGRTEGVRKIAVRFGVSPGTVQRISRPFDGASVAAAA
jgi:hypothetical protein